LNGTSFLTVRETEDFMNLGGLIGFKLEGPRVRIQIARETAERNMLRISSKLLSLAEIVKR
jgi:YfiR/HmsC-like